MHETCVLSTLQKPFFGVSSYILTLPSRWGMMYIAAVVQFMVWDPSNLLQAELSDRWL